MPRPSKPPPYEQYVEVLRRDGYRVTNPRKAILRLLAAARRPLSAEDIHQQIGPGESDLVTVYRNLETFERAGIIQPLVMEKGRRLFELVEENHHHHHIICRRCHRTERLDYCDAEKLEKLANDLGYSQVSHVLELYGVCAECEKAEQARSR